MADRQAQTRNDNSGLCACGASLRTPHERRKDKCLDCERMDERMRCAQCGAFVGMAYCDGRPTLCSDECEARYYDEESCYA